MEPIEVRLARIEEHMVHVKGDCREIKNAMIPMRKELDDVRIQRAVDEALRKRDRRWTHGISAMIASFITLLGYFWPYK